MLTCGLAGAGWASRILGGETRETSAARQTRASGGTGLGLHGQRCHCGHGVAHGAHAAVTQWWGRRFTGDHRAGFELRQGVPDTARSKPCREDCPVPRNTGAVWGWICDSTERRWSSDTSSARAQLSRDRAGGATTAGRIEELEMAVRYVWVCDNCDC